MKKQKTKLNKSLSVRISEPARQYIDDVMAKGQHRSYSEFVDLLLKNHKTRNRYMDKDNGSDS